MVTVESGRIILVAPLDMGIASPFKLTTVVIGMVIQRLGDAGNQENRHRYREKPNNQDTGGRK